MMFRASAAGRGRVTCCSWRQLHSSVPLEKYDGRRIVMEEATGFAKHVEE